MACYRKLRRQEQIPESIPDSPLPERWSGEDEIWLLRELCRRSFWAFFLYAFGAGINPKGQRWIDPEIHEPMAEWFQLHVDDWMKKRQLGQGEQKHLAVLVHREVGKTTMFSQAGQAWLHLRDPELSSYTGSEKLELAQKIMGGVKSMFDDSDPHALFPKLYGVWSENARTWTAKEATHGARKNTSRRDPSLGTFGVETSIVGAHPDVIFYDDPISYERMVTDTSWLESVNTQVTSLFPVIQSDGLVVWVGTRYDDLDHFGRAFKDEGIKSIAGIETDSIEVSEDGKWDVYFMAGRDKEGKPTTPKVWPEKRLQDYQRRDPLLYAAQIMNDPSLSEFNPLTKEQVQQCLIDANQVPWSALRFGISCDVAFWDGKSRERKDDTVFIIHGYPRNGSGDVYVIEANGSPTWRMEDFMHRLVATVQRYRRQGRRIVGISDEMSVAGRKDVTVHAMKNFFADANEPMPPYFELNRGGTKKVQRIIAAASFWQDGHVKAVRGAPGIEKLLEQMGKIGQMMVTKNPRDDYADAHADAFQPCFYSGMKRLGNQKPPYAPGSIPIETEGLSRDLWDDSEAGEWLRECARPPIR